MKATIAKRYSFSAGHWLPNVPPDHPCRVQHGHNYVVEIECAGNIDPVMGWVVDFHELDRYVKVFIADLDHSNLNDSIPNPTAENLALWFIAALSATAVGPYVSSVTVWETPKCRARVDVER